MDLAVVVITAHGQGTGRPLKIFQRLAAPVDGSLVDVAVVRPGADGHRRRGDQDALEAVVAGVVAVRHDGRRGMLGLGVAAQINLALERPRADAAGERLEAGVLTTVCNEVRRLTKGLATLTTNVWLLTCNIHNTQRIVICPCYFVGLLAVY